MIIYLYLIEHGLDRSSELSLTGYNPPSRIKTNKQTNKLRTRDPSLPYLPETPLTRQTHESAPLQ